MLISLLLDAPMSTLSQSKSRSAVSLPRARTARERIAANREAPGLKPLHVIGAVAVLATVAAYLTFSR
jgi:hypothetical protein